MTDYTPAVPYYDPQNLSVGRACLMRAPAGRQGPGGWVTLGGGRIYDFVAAHEYAGRLHALMEKMDSQPATLEKPPLKHWTDRVLEEFL